MGDQAKADERIWGLNRRVYAGSRLAATGCRGHCRFAET